MPNTRPAPRILDLARDMLASRDEYRELIDTGQPRLAGPALDEEAITWEAIVRRLRTVLAAR